MPKPTSLATLLAATAVGAAALIAGARPAHAQFDFNLDVDMNMSTSVNKTVTRCVGRTAADQAILASADANLIFTADGDLRLTSTNNFVEYLWHSGTAGTGEVVCLDKSGKLLVRDASGAVLWTKAGASVPILENQFDSYLISFKLDRCDLSASFVRTGLGGWAVMARGTLWNQPATCPPTPDAALGNGGDGWCADTSEEQTLVAAPWASLIWTTDGNLILRGNDGTELWRAGYTGTAAKLCFEPTGRLAIYNGGGGVIWSQGASTTAGDYYVGISDCDVETRAVQGGGQLWSRSYRCPQSKRGINRTWYRTASEQTLIEDDETRLVMDPSGNLVLRDRAGGDRWTTALPTGVGYRAVMQADGNLVVYDASGASKFATNTAGQGVNLMAVDGCALRLYAGADIKWTVGSPTCATTLDNATPVSMPSSGNQILLRSPEAKLVWQADGNLVLYTTTGSVLWASNTIGAGNARGRRLDLQADGNLVIYGNAGALWSSGTYGISGVMTMAIGDQCTWTLATGSNVRWTGNASCRVTQYEFVKRDGDRTLGASLRSAITSEIVSGGARLDNAASFTVSLLGNEFELLGANAARIATTAGVESEEGLVDILGESGVSPNVEVEKLFVGREQTVMVGPVPVVLKYGIEGELGLSMANKDGALVVTPHGGLFLIAEAGVGGDLGVIGASAGVSGTITLFEVQLPFSLDITTSSGAYSYALRGDVHLETLTGSLSLFAKAYVKVFGIKISVKRTRELWGWDGITYDKNLFTKTGAF